MLAGCRELNLSKDPELVRIQTGAWGGDRHNCPSNWSCVALGGGRAPSALFPAHPTTSLLSPATRLCCSFFLSGCREWQIFLKQCKNIIISAFATLMVKWSGKAEEPVKMRNSVSLSQKMAEDTGVAYKKTLRNKISEI